MRGVRYFADRRYGVVVAAGLAAFLGYSLSAWLRRTGRPETTVGLAGDQVGLAVVAVAVGAALAALVSSRHHRRAGRDLWVTATRSALRLSTVQCAAVAAPVLGGWLTYLGVTTLAQGIPRDVPVAVAVHVLSVAAVTTGVALGQVIGLLAPAALAVPVAFASAYAGTVAIASAGDDSWWQWLGPGFGDGLGPVVHGAWWAGELLWFSGVTVSLLLVAALLGSYPRRLPAPVAAVTVVLLAVGALLLFVNGPDASGLGRP